jgi:hypothetical protein
LSKWKQINVTFEHLLGVFHIEVKGVQQRFIHYHQACEQPIEIECVG